MSRLEHTTKPVDAVRDGQAGRSQNNAMIRQLTVMNTDAERPRVSCGPDGLASMNRGTRPIPRVVAATARHTATWAPWAARYVVIQ